MCSKRLIETKQPDVTSPLVRSYKSYGGKAQPIYEECCNLFGWDKSKSFLFGVQRPLFARDATREHYDVWFLCHSNWTATKGGTYKNEISKDWKTIEEFWEQTPECYQDEPLRVVFAKNKNVDYTYIFIGIFQPEYRVRVTEQDGKKGWIKTYRFVSENYPKPENLAEFLGDYNEDEVYDEQELERIREARKTFGQHCIKKYNENK